VIEVEVSYHDDMGEPAQDDEVRRVYVVSETEHAVVLSVETATKYPQPDIYSGQGVMFRTLMGNYAAVRVTTKLPYYAFVVAAPGRYSLFVFLFHDVREDSVEVYSHSYPDSPPV
jgi:hypothetical protein